MNIKRIVCLLLAVIMVIGLCACAGKSVPSSVDEEGRFAYTIVRSGETTIPAVEDAAKLIRATIKDNFDVKVTLTKDTAYEDFDGNYEILVGNTNREESAEALKRLTDNRDNYAKDFIVAVIGDKICIQAASDEILTKAVDWFVDTFCDSFETWALLKTNYEFIYEHASGTLKNTANGEDVGLYSVVMPRQVSYLVGMVAEEHANFYNSYGYNVEVLEDIDEAKEYEVLIGDCDREASKSVTVEGDNYVIKVIGNKIVIKGGNDLATHTAANVFLSEVKKATETGTGFAWSDGHTVNGKYDSAAEGVYTLNWNDEFEGSTIDYNKWGDYRIEAQGTAGDSCLGGTVYWQNVFEETKYPGNNVKDLIYVADGSAHMVAQRVTDKDFVGAQMSTYWTMLYRYGILEIRANLAPEPAAVSLWVNGASTTGEDFKARYGDQSRFCMTEIDILENFGKKESYASNIHRWWTMYDINGKTTGSAHNSMDGNAKYTGNSTNNKKVVYNTEKYGDYLNSDYRIFTFYWDGTSMKFALDGRMYCDYQYTENESVSVHCLMNYFIMRCRMGLASYGMTYDPDEHPEMCEAKIDYVRLYQNEPSNAQMITGWNQKEKTGTSVTRYPDNDLGGTY